MKSERWKEIKQLCYLALQRPGSERAVFLEQACAGDESLRREVEALLEYEERAGNFMESPALKVAAREMALDGFPSLAGKQVSHYQILTRLGAGGMGDVYLARDSRLDRSVALKILPVGVTADQDHMRRFVQEARAASAINHPNVATVYDIGEDDGIRFIAMEYVEGQTLASKMQGQPLDLPQVVEIGVQVADALSDAHAKGITHRDIKPTNLMLTARGQVKVLDFGIAKMTRPQQQTLAGDPSAIATTAAGVILGTVQYMSPEQVLGRDVDQRSDIFSLGVLLYQMATGALPFDGASAGETMDRILHTQPEAVMRLNGSVPDELERIVDKCLEKDRERRYQSAQELMLDLGNLRSSSLRQSPLRMPETAGSTDAQPSRIPPGIGWLGWLKTVRSRRWVLGLTVLFVTCAVAVLWILGDRATLSFSARDWILITDFDNQTGNPLFDKSLDTAFTVSLEQSSHANVFPRSRIADTLKRMGKGAEERITEETGREICLRENLRGVISSSIGRFGQEYVLSARLIDPINGETVRSYMERAKGQDHILSALDAIAGKIRRDLGESLSSVSGSSRELPKVTTSSLQALKLYADGVGLWGLGKYREAVKLYESALQYDPDFAKAHAALGSAYSSFVYNETTKGREHLEKALRLSGRTTERERMSIEIQYHHGLGHYTEAYDVYQIYLKTYPDDSAVRSNFGNLLMRNDQEEEAIRQYKEVLRIEPRNAGVYINIATAFGNWGKHKDRLSYYDKAFELDPSRKTQTNILHEYGFALLHCGEAAKAREVFTMALSTPNRAQALRSLALLDLYHGKYREAKPRLREAIVLNESARWMLSKARNHVYLSIVFDGEGDRANRLSELDKAAKSLEGLGPQATWWVRVGVEYARSGSVQKAGRVLDLVRQQADLKNPYESSRLHQLEGEIELLRGNSARALELLTLADRERQTSLSVESLAHGYGISGKEELTIRTYEKLIEMGSNSIGNEMQQNWIAAHYHLAKAYLSRGEKEKAFKTVNVLLKLWKDADSNLPLLTEARRLAKRLEN